MQRDGTHLELEAAGELLGNQAVRPAAPPPQPTVERRGPDLLALANDVRRLKKTMRLMWLTCAAVAIAAFFAGWMLRPTPSAAPVLAAAPALTLEEERALDFEPAAEDELTEEERALAAEVIASAEPPPVVAEKKATVVKPKVTKVAKVTKKKVSAKRVLVASNSGRAADITKSSTKPKVDARAQQEARVLGEALTSGRGSRCKARFDAISEIVAKTRVAANREAGILLRARCFADTYRSEEAKNEFRRYLREFPSGKFADEARRVLAL